MPPVRVLIVDDEELIRQGLRIFVNADPRTTVVGTASNGREALVQSIDLAPDVILMDIQMPEVDGVEATREIVASQADVAVLSLTTFSAQHHVVAALRAGASGYLVKDTSPADLVEAIVDVHQGRSALSPQISRELIAAVRAQPEPTAFGDEASPLTTRELTVVRLLSQGMSNVEIARELHLAEATVKANFGRIMTKWGVRDRVQVLIRAVRAGLVTLEAPTVGSV